MLVLVVIAGRSYSPAFFRKYVFFYDSVRRGKGPGFSKRIRVVSYISFWDLSSRRSHLLPAAF